MIRWTYGFTLKERKNRAELKRTAGSGFSISVTFIITKREADGIGQSRRLRTTWWNVKTVHYDIFSHSNINTCFFVHDNLNNNNQYI